MPVTRTSDKHIEITPVIVGAKPHIAGRRFTVREVVILHERMGYGAAENSTEHELTLTDVYTAPAYFFDYRAKIDQSIREEEAVRGGVVRTYTLEAGPDAGSVHGGWLSGSSSTPKYTCQRRS